MQLEETSKRVRESEELNPRGYIPQTRFLIDDLRGSYRGAKAGTLEKW